MQLKLRKVATRLQHSAPEFFGHFRPCSFPERTYLCSNGIYKTKDNDAQNVYLSQMNTGGGGHGCLTVTDTGTVTTLHIGRPLPWQF